MEKEAIKKRALVGQDCRLKRLNQSRERPEMGKRRRRRWKQTKGEIHVNSFSLQFLRPVALKQATKLNLSKTEK